MIFDGKATILQESKNATNATLPPLSDIKDGLFKPILYGNLDRLEQDGKQIAFATRLKLTGRGVQSSVRLPCDADTLIGFLATNANVFTAKQKTTIALLNDEAMRNRLTIEIGANGA